MSTTQFRVKRAHNPSKPPAWWGTDDNIDFTWESEQAVRTAEVLATEAEVCYGIATAPWRQPKIPKPPAYPPPLRPPPPPPPRVRQTTAPDSKKMSQRAKKTAEDCKQQIMEE